MKNKMEIEQFLQTIDPAAKIKKTSPVGFRNPFIATTRFQCLDLGWEFSGSGLKIQFTEEGPMPAGFEFSLPPGLDWNGKIVAEFWTDVCRDYFASIAETQTL